jgi:hypothetical protein
MISMANVARGEGRTGSRGATDINGAAASGNSCPGTAAPPSLADDLLEGGEEIAEFLLGDRSKKSVRKVFYLSSEVDPANRPPIFKLGNQKLAARRSRLLRWIEEREAAATGSQGA